MEYTAEDYTFWGQVLPQLFWLLIIVVACMIWAWIMTDRERAKDDKYIKNVKEYNRKALLKKASAKKVVKDNPPNLN